MSLTQSQTPWHAVISTAKHAGVTISEIKLSISVPSAYLRNVLSTNATWWYLTLNSLHIYPMSSLKMESTIGKSICSGTAGSSPRATLIQSGVLKKAAITWFKSQITVWKIMSPASAERHSVSNADRKITFQLPAKLWLYGMKRKRTTLKI